MLKNTKQGIVLIAVNSPYYGRMAYNLAVTIKAADPNMPIAVIQGGAGLNHLSDDQISIFDYITEAPEGVPPFKLKLHLYDLSPFDKTLFLDSDMLLMTGQQPGELFRQLSGIQFTGITEGWYDYQTQTDYGNVKYHYWCNPAQACELHDLKNRLYQWRSELLYFERCKETKALFKLALKLYEKPLVDFKGFVDGAMPDELAFNLATAKLDMHPHVIKWQPVYWHRIHNFAPLNSIIHTHFFLSAGGNWATAEMKNAYNRIASFAHRKLGLQYLFTLQSKKAIIKERVKL
jgi:hypothetical protein